MAENNLNRLAEEYFWKSVDFWTRETYKQNDAIYSTLGNNVDALFQINVMDNAFFISQARMKGVEYFFHYEAIGDNLQGLDNPIPDFDVNASMTIDAYGTARLSYGKIKLGIKYVLPDEFYGIAGLGFSF